MINKLKTKKPKGFTLIELLIAVTVFGILAGIGTVTFNSIQEKGRDTKRKEDLQSIKIAVEAFFQENGYYPGADDPSGSPVFFSDQPLSQQPESWIPGIVPDYIKKIPKDPKQAKLNFQQQLGILNHQFFNKIISKTIKTVFAQTNTITAVDFSPSGMGWTDITIGTDGLPIVSYVDKFNGSLKVVWCSLKDCSDKTNNKITTIDSTSLNRYTSIAVGADGKPVISYINQVAKVLRVAKCGNVQCTAGNTTANVDSVGNLGRPTSIAIAGGLPVISYYDYTNKDLKVAKCGNADCSLVSGKVSVDTVGNVGEHSALAIGSDGFPVISYRDSTNWDLKIAKCGNADCIINNGGIIADSVGTLGTGNSIALDSSGLPMVSYIDHSNGDLKFIKCLTNNCTTFSSPKVVNAAGAATGNFTAIAKSNDGSPIISYVDYSTGGLKIAKCTNNDCSGVATISVVDYVAATGPSVAIGTDTLPIISYGDDLGDMKIAHCGSPDCVEGAASPTPSPTPSPPPPPGTPTPVPTLTPTPAPPWSPYRYEVTLGGSAFALWTQLENENDQEIYDKPRASCKQTPPPNTAYNYCVQNQ